MRLPPPTPARAACLPLLLLGVLGCAPAAAPPTGPLASAPGALLTSKSIDASIDPTIDQGLDGFVDFRDGRVTELHFRSEFRLGPLEPEVHEWNVRADVLGEQIVDGLAYRRVVETDLTHPDWEPFESLFRQDRSGLYLWQKDAGPIARHVIAADVPRHTINLAQLEEAIADAGLDATTAAAYRRAAARIAARGDALGVNGPPGGVGTSEITMLRYPLRPHASWVGRVQFNVWTVEARENLETPMGRIPAWRLNIDLPKYFNPNERYQTWWGAPGEVKRLWVSDETALDENGKPIGTLLYRQEAELVSYTPGS